MDSFDKISLLSGPLVLLGYLVGTVTVMWLRRGDHGPRASDHLVEAFVAVAMATLAWKVIDEVSPGNASSRLGLYSNQVLTAWQSVALWTGVGVTAGFAAPITRRFQGTPGIAAAGALVAVYFPWIAVSVLAVVGVAIVLSRPDDQVRLAAILTALPLAWLAWVLDWIPAWGSSNGPEATVWIMVLTMVLGVRWWSDRTASTPSGARERS